MGVIRLVQAKVGQGNATLMHTVRFARRVADVLIIFWSRPTDVRQATKTVKRVLEQTMVHERLALNNAEQAHLYHLEM